MSVPVCFSHRVRSELDCSLLLFFFVLLLSCSVRIGLPILSAADHPFPPSILSLTFSVPSVFFMNRFFPLFASLNTGREAFPAFSLDTAKGNFPSSEIPTHTFSFSRAFGEFQKSRRRQTSLFSLRPPFVATSSPFSTIRVMFFERFYGTPAPPRGPKVQASSFFTTWCSFAKATVFSSCWGRGGFSVAWNRYKANLVDPPHCFHPSSLRIPQTRPESTTISLTPTID